MTANQIAYASMVEQTRHDKAVEDETSRHNKATEDLQDRHDSWENDWHTAQNNINLEYNNYLKEYNWAELELKKADAAEKWKYQDIMSSAQKGMEAAQIKLADTDAWYKNVLAEVEKAQVKETQRHNYEVESINKASNALNEKKLEYERQQWNTENFINMGKLNLEERKFQQAINVDIWNMTRDKFNIDIATQNAETNRLNAKANQLSAEAQTTNAEAAWLNAERNQEMKAYDKWNSVSQTFNNFSRGIYADTMAAVTVFKPSFVSNAVKTTAKEAAKLLFKD